MYQLPKVDTENEVNPKSRHFSTFFSNFVSVPMYLLPFTL